MSDASGAERSAKIKSANINLQGWLHSVVQTHRQLRELLSPGFEELKPWPWLPLDKDMSLKVQPHDGVVLEGESYDSLLGASPDGMEFDERHPFIGGAMIGAQIHSETRGGTPALALDLHCLREGPDGRTSIAYNYRTDGVVVPDGAIERVGFEVVDAPPMTTPR
jgi:hypothetical protein